MWRGGLHGPEADEGELLELARGAGVGDVFGPLVDRFLGDLGGASTGAGPVDARENVRFRGAHLASWVHDRYPRVGCVLALEFKKTFMDEWTGESHHESLAAMRAMITQTLPLLEDRLKVAR